MAWADWAVAARPTGDAALAEARRRALQFDFNGALQLFREAERTGADRRAARFGEAVTLLNVQPLRASNIVRATALLDELIENGPADDDYTIAARYFRARIAYRHQSPADPAEAAERFAALYRDFPDRRLGQQAWVKLTIMRLYDPRDDTPRGELIDAMGAEAMRFTDQAARRDLHLALGYAAMDFELPSNVVRQHLEAAWAAGLEGHGGRGNVLVSLGTLAEEQGDVAAARSYYREFLARHQRDGRAHTIAQRLAALGASTEAEENTR